MISLVLITKNEAKKIRRCIESCQSLVNDIVVLDSGSTDKTEHIAKSLGARFHTQSWIGFGKQKQKAVSLAVNDWILCLDADEYLSKALQEAIRQINLDTKQTIAYSMNRCNLFLGRWLRHGEGYPDRMIRLFNRKHAYWSDDAVHEKIICNGKISHIDADIMHESADTLTRYISKQNLYTETQALTLPPKTTPAILLHMLVSPFARFMKNYVFRLGFLDGIPGFVHAGIGALSSYLKYLKMYEQTQHFKVPNSPVE